MSPLALLIPCYNAAKYLPRLLDTVRAQTQPFAEILCYDDGSKDDTVQVARDLGLEIIVGEKNRGPAHARNRLAHAATSPWIHYHDADDLLTPKYVEKISPLMTDDADVVVCQMDWITETTHEMVVAWRFDGPALAADPVGCNLRNPIGVIACAIRRETLLKVGGFDPDFRTWEDGDVQVRLAHAGARYRVHPEVLAIGLRHERGISSERGGELVLEDRTRLLENYLRTLAPRYRPVVGEVAERHAAQLLVNNHRPDLIERDLAVCRAAGWTYPSSHNLVLRVARAILPNRWLLQQQERHRQRKAMRQFRSK